MSNKNKDYIYWGIDANNKLIISDQPVTDATGDRGGSFEKDATFKKNHKKHTVDMPWSAYVDKITSVEVQGRVAPISTEWWFYGLIYANTIDVTQLDTSNVTNMSDMFSCAGFKATSVTITGMEKWNTSNVTNMHGLFFSVGYNSTTFDIGDISNWDTSNVTDMSEMFSGAGHNATNFKLNLSNWNTSKVTNMSSMFEDTGYNSTTFDIGDISNWDVSNVKNIENLFYGINAKIIPNKSWEYIGYTYYKDINAMCIYGYSSKDSDGKAKIVASIDCDTLELTYYDLSAKKNNKIKKTIDNVIIEVNEKKNRPHVSNLDEVIATINKNKANKVKAKANNRGKDAR